MKKKIILLIMVGIITNNFNFFSQISYGGRPITIHNDLQNIKRSSSMKNSEVFVEAPSRTRINEEMDSLRGACQTCYNGRFYGKEISVNINLFDNAECFITEDSTKVWLLNVKTDDAVGFQVIFDKFHIVDGGKLFIYNEDRSMTLGAFTSSNNRECRTFLTQPITGNSIFLEYSEPHGVTGSEVFVGNVVYMFDDLGAYKGPFSPEGSSTCQKNTACLSSSYDTEVKSTLLILEKVSGQYWGSCSGALINDGNNYEDNNYPYVLSANHCYENEFGFGRDVKNWVFLYRHESLSCVGDGSEISKEIIQSSSSIGASVLSRDQGSRGNDYLILKLNNTVNDIAKFDIAFAGWNTQDIDVLHSKKFIGVHHPAGDIKKASVSTLKAISSSWNGNSIGEGHWLITFNEGFNTEPGSSGSPLFNDKHQIVGICSGGPTTVPSCDSPIDERYTWYGKLSNGIIPEMINIVSESHIPVYDPNKDPNKPTENDPFRVNILIPTFMCGPDYFEAVIQPVSHPFKRKKYKISVSSYRPSSGPGDYFPPSEYEFHDREGIDEPIKIAGSPFLSGSWNILKLTTTIDGINYEKKQEFNYYYCDKLDTLQSCAKTFVGFYPPSNDEKKLEYYTSEEKPDYYKISENSLDIIARFRPEEHNMTYSYTKKDCTTRTWFKKIFGPDIEGMRWVSFKLNGEPIKSTVYKTTRTWYEADILKDPNATFFVEDQVRVHFDKPGLYTVEVAMMPGYFSFQPYSYEISAKTKLGFVEDTKKKISYKLKFLKVDCSSIVNITDENILHYYEAYFSGYANRLGAGTAIVSNATFEEVDYTYNIYAYEKVILKPGTIIKEGTKTHMKIIECPQMGKNRKENIYSKEDDQNEIYLSTKELSLDSEINIYPNPTTGFINLDIPPVMEVTSIEVYDLNGKIIIENKYTSNPSEIDLTGNPSGLYLIRIYYEGGLYDQKITLK